MLIKGKGFSTVSKKLCEIVRQTSECLHKRCRLWVKTGIPVMHFLWDHSNPFPVVNNSKQTSVFVAKNIYQELGMTKKSALMMN